MKKRWLIGIGAVVLIGAVVSLALPATIYVPLGYMRHEAFYEGKPASYWARGFQRDGFYGRWSPPGDVGKELRAAGPAAVPVLLEMLDHPSAQVRWEALITLGLIEPPVEIPVSRLSDVLEKETDGASFEMVAKLLVQKSKPATVDALCRVLRHQQDANARLWAMVKLAKLGSAAEPAIPALTETLHDPADILRYQAASLLWRFKQPAGPLVAAVSEALETSKDRAGYGLQVLGQMGREAKPALPVLVKMLESDEDQREAVVRVLGSIGPDAAPAIPELITLLADSNDRLRRTIAGALARMGPAAKQAIPALRGLLGGREALMGTSVLLFAMQPPCGLVLIPLIGVTNKTSDSNTPATARAIREAIKKIDMAGADRAGTR